MIAFVKDLVLNLEFYVKIKANGMTGHKTSANLNKNGINMINKTITSVESDFKITVADPVRGGGKNISKCPPPFDPPMKKGARYTPLDPPLRLFFDVIQSMGWLKLANYIK